MNLRYLWIQYNKLTSVNEKIFMPLRKIFHLSVAINDLTFIHPDAFRNKPDLWYLYLQSNKLLKRLDPEWFIDLPTLRGVYLYDMDLSKIPANIFKNNNLLTSLDTNIFGTNQLNLNQLRLQHNRLEAIDRRIFNHM